MQDTENNFTRVREQAQEAGPKQVARRSSTPRRLLRAIFRGMGASPASSSMLPRTECSRRIDWRLCSKDWQENLRQGLPELKDNRLFYTRGRIRALLA